MRILGFALLFLGFLLCVSIAWAAIGFLAMGFGLICFMIAEKQKKASKLLVVKDSVQATRLDAVWQGGPALASDAAGKQKPNQDGDLWKLLVESDSEIADLVRILSHHGPKYIDQLASVYVLFNDKALLPIILELITSARQNAKAPGGGKLELSPLPEIVQEFFQEEVAEEIVRNHQALSLSITSETTPFLGKDSQPALQPSMRAETSALQTYRGSVSRKAVARPSADTDDWADLESLFENLNVPRR